MAKIVCKNEGTFTIDGEEVVLKIGDVVPAALESAALAQGWGVKAPAKKAAAK